MRSLMIAGTLSAALAGAWTAWPGPAGAETPLTAPAAAEGPTDGPESAPLSEMDDAERTLLRREIRDYLLEHPEVIREAIEELQRRQTMAEIQSAMEIVDANAEELFHDPNSWVGGNVDGDVTLVEFLDYQCGYCKRAHSEVAALLDSDPKVRMVIKEFPILGPESVVAAHAAISALRLGDAAAYKRFSDNLMTYGGKLDDTAIDRLADRAGIDVAAMRAGMDDPEIDNVVQANYELARKLKVSGTPTFVIGKRVVRGYVPLDQLAETVAVTRKHMK